MSLIKSIICIVLTLGSSVVYAEDLWLCDNSCSSSYSLARNMSRIYNDGDIFSVININDNTASTYRVDIIYRFGEMFETVRNITTTFHASSSLNEINSAIDNFEKGSYRIPTDLPDTTYDDELNSVHDFLINRESIVPIIAWIDENPEFEERISELEDFVERNPSNIESIVRKVLEDIPWTVEIVFEDGSKMDVTFNLKAVNNEDEGTTELEVVNLEFADDSAKDKKDRPVPDELSDIDDGMTFRFDNDEEFFTFFDYSNIVFEGELDWRTRCNEVKLTVCSTEDGVRSCVKQILCL